MPRYSILVPSYDPELRKLDMVMDLIRSIEVNSVGEDYELIIRKNGPSYTESHNDALRTSRGDFIIVLNDDVLIEDKEWIRKMTKEDCMSSWRLGKFGLTGADVPDFACWGMSRKVFEKIGYLDEAFKDGINFEDNDYIERARELGFSFYDAHVKLKHFGDKTFSEYFSKDKWNKIYKNQTIFYNKWKEKLNLK